MTKFDQAKMLMQVRKIQKELANQIITVEAGEQKIKKIHIDPAFIDLEDIGMLERWVEDAVKTAIAGNVVYEFTGRCDLIVADHYLCKIKWLHDIGMMIQDDTRF